MPHAFQMFPDDSGFVVGNSGLFTASESDYMNQNGSGNSGDSTTFSLSFWVKRVSTGSNQTIFQQRATGGNTPQFQVQFLSGNTIRLLDQNSGNQLVANSDQTYTSTTEWYHIFVKIDTTEADASNRYGLAVNNSAATFTSPTQYSINDLTPIGSTDRILLGAQKPNGSETLDSYSDLYMSEFYLIVGQALSASDFGVLSGSDWVPKAYTGSFGTDDIYLDFSNGADLGEDSSGNANDFANNGASQSTDVPS